MRNQCRHGRLKTIQRLCKGNVCRERARKLFTDLRKGCCPQE